MAINPPIGRLFNNANRKKEPVLPGNTNLGGIFNQETKPVGPDGEGIDLGSFGASALKYLVPAARLIGNERALRNLRKDSVVNFKPVSLRTGVVRDIPRPNFGFRYRDPQGSSLMEHTAGLKFGDAQQREAERNYEIQNALSRIDQRSKQTQIENQQEMMNTDMENRARAMNAQNANYEKLLRMGQQEELQLGLTETSLNDSTQRNYLKASQKADAAANILRYGTPGTPEYNQALQYYMNTINLERKVKNKFGGKLKTKFAAYAK